MGRGARYLGFAGVLPTLFAHSVAREAFRLDRTGRELRRDNGYKTTALKCSLHLVPHGPKSTEHDVLLSSALTPRNQSRIGKVSMSDYLTLSVNRPIVGHISGRSTSGKPVQFGN